MSNLLVQILGFPATLFHGDTLVIDRWLWLRKQLSIVPKGSKTLLDVGCGTGAFTIGAARHGYRSLDVSWNKRNQEVAAKRASLCGTDLATFEVQDVRTLDERSEFKGGFDVIICCENIEHIMNDTKLMVDMSDCLKPGGTLLLTTPSHNFKAITPAEDGPLSTIEDGGHVRRGYTPERLRELCKESGLIVRQIGSCGGFTSQKITGILRMASELHPLFGWALILPLRPIPPVIDLLIKKWTNWPPYMVTLVAEKPYLVK